MQDPLPLIPFPGPVDATVSIPGSKSYTNRALLIAAMADGRSVLHGALFSDDTERMADSLRRLGLDVTEDAQAAQFTVEGRGGAFPAESAELFIGNAGTATRFLTAFVALGQGRYVLDGVPRMRQRPIQPLLDALQALGVRATSIEGTGCPPVLVEAEGLTGGEVTIPGNLSSQYFSALMIVGAATRQGLTLNVAGELVSQPYIALTADIMTAFGVRSEIDPDYRRLHVPGGQTYRAREYFIEPDASSASYFFGAAAITGGRVRVEHLGQNSAQGDIAFLDAVEQMGCEVLRGDDFLEVRGGAALRGISVDANACSDVAFTLCGLAPFAEGPTEIRNIEHSRVQECDRITAAVTELRRLGQEVQEFPDGLRITPRPITPATVQTYHDHRIAMAFALVGLRASGVQIADPGCTAKTFPDYWQRLEALRPRT